MPSVLRGSRSTKRTSHHRNEIQQLRVVLAEGGPQQRAIVGSELHCCVLDAILLRYSHVEYFDGALKIDVCLERSHSSAARKVVPEAVQALVRIPE